ncbi:MAG: hypothetical protein ACI3YT_07720 [Prevotella sp.]
MRSKIIAFLASALMVPCFAEENPALLVKTAETEQEVGLADIGKVTYTDTDMVIVKKDGGTMSIPMDNIVSMSFTSLQPSSISMTMDDAEKSEAIYTINGVKTGNTDDKGIYIIKVGKETRKIVR